jgi:catechol 2,3-dioxygenase-like lactoylglutathione lyase family enzyme
MIHGLNHFTITAEDRDQTLDFYCGLLGLVEAERPDLGFPGTWQLFTHDPNGAKVELDFAASEPS